MKRAAIIIAVTAALGVTASLAGAAGPRLSSVPYAPGSQYVYSGSGEKIGTLTGRDLGTQFNTVEGQVSR